MGVTWAARVPVASATSSGLRRVRLALSGAAPIAPKVLEYFWALGVPVREGYGQTENTAAGDLHAGRRRPHRQGGQALSGRRDPRSPTTARS